MKQTNELQNYENSYYLGFLRYVPIIEADLRYVQEKFNFHYVLAAII